jgi:predicted metal-dependent hydrolase
MQRVLNFRDRTLEYSLKESLRARRVRISINLDGSVIVTMPKK